MKEFIIVAIFTVIATSTAAAQTTISGPAGITDGDTIRISGTRIRLLGIDAPETHQTCSKPDGTRWACGQEAAKRLQRFIEGRPVTCTSTETDKYGRSLATCSVAGKDIGAWMVRSGWAVAYRQYSDRYAPDEEKARKSRAGIWKGPFEMPWEWRKENR